MQLYSLINKPFLLSHFTSILLLYSLSGAKISSFNIEGCKDTYESAGSGSDMKA